MQCPSIRKYFGVYLTATLPGICGHEGLRAGRPAVAARPVRAPAPGADEDDATAAATAEVKFFRIRVTIQLQGSEKLLLTLK